MSSNSLRTVPSEFILQIIKKPTLLTTQPFQVFSHYFFHRLDLNSHTGISDNSLFMLDCVVHNIWKILRESFGNMAGSVYLCRRNQQ